MPESIAEIRKQAIHGGDVERVVREYGIPKEEIIDFSANINPIPFPPGFKESLINRIEDIRRYPEREYLEISEILSHYTGYPAEWIMVGNGATELIYLVARALSPQRVLLPVPCFAEYQRAVEGARGRVEEYPLDPELNFQLELEHLIRTMDKGYDMLFLCNPNNPTGTWIERERIDKLLKRAEKTGVFVVLDETFAEFVGEGKTGTMQNIRDYNNGIVIGALTKFFAIPGLRLGYCIANPKVLDRLSAWKEPWTVNSLASAAGIFLLNHQDFIDKTRQWIREERQFFYSRLKGLSGFHVYDSYANFFLIKVLKQDWTSQSLKRELEKKGLMVRDASSFRGLNDRFIRIAVKDRESNLKLLRAFQECGL